MATKLKEYMVIEAEVEVGTQDPEFVSAKTAEEALKKVLHKSRTYNITYNKKTDEAFATRGSGFDGVWVWAHQYEDEDKDEDDYE